MGSSKIQFELPTWLRSTAKNCVDELPIESKEGKQIVTLAAVTIENFVKAYEDLPKTQTFSLMEKEELERTGGVEAIVQLHSDFSEMVFMLRTMAFMRAYDLLNSYLRSARTKEYFTLANMGRSALELGIVVADSSRTMMPLLQSIADVPKGSLLGLSSEKEDQAYIAKAEDDLYKAVFGSRIGTGNIGDKHKTSPWGENEIETERTVSRNIMTHFQGRARRMKHDVALADLRIYEIMCDIVHPSAFGYQPFFMETKSELGFCKYRVSKSHRNSNVTGYISTASLYCLSHGLGLLAEWSRDVAALEAQVRVALEQMREAAISAETK